MTPYEEGRLLALEKLGMRVLPPIRSKMRSENEPVIQESPWAPPVSRNPFDRFDEIDPRGPKKRAKVAALGNIFKNVSGTQPLNFPSGATQMLKAPKPQMATGPRVKMPQLAGVDPRASKPPGMNLQHQVMDNAHTMDSANSMSSPQRRFVSPL